MTMQHPIHPDDERLAALAGDDPEVASDAALRAHVDACDRCGPLVRELASLRAAMGELPDLVPSRPLQLLPPVSETQRAARGGWLRRLAAPAMGAGFVLVIVGAIGSSGFSLMGMASSGAESADVPEAAAPSAMAGGAGASSGEAPSLDSGESYSRSHPATASGSDNGAPQPSRRSLAEPSGEEAAPPADRGGSGDLFAPADPRLPWLVVLALGVGLLVAGIYLRFAQQPRAG
jgi:hypothetical protein